MTGSWYKGKGSPEAYDEHFDKWTRLSQRQARDPWPYKIVIAKKAKGFVLDAGCGYGCIARFIANGVFLDFSPVALKKRWVGGKRPRILASVEDMPFMNNVFDSVIAIEVIEHTDKPTRFIKEVHRVLKPNGFFGLSFPWSDVSPTHKFKVIAKKRIVSWLTVCFKRYRFDVPPQRKERGMIYAYK